MKPRDAAILAVIATVVLTQCEAKAHDRWDWIRIGDYRDWMGQSCCGPADCEKIEASKVEERADGSFFIAPGDHVERRDTKVSPDGNYWRCTWHENGVKKTRRGCFWRPGRES